MDKFLKKLHEKKVSFNIDTWVPESPNFIAITFSKDICKSRYLHDITEPTKVDMADVFMLYLDKFLKEYWKFGDKPGLAYDFENMLD